MIRLLTIVIGSLMGLCPLVAMASTTDKVVKEVPSSKQTTSIKNAGARPSPWGGGAKFKYNATFGPEAGSFDVGLWGQYKANNGVTFLFAPHYGYLYFVKREFISLELSLKKYLINSPKVFIYSAFRTGWMTRYIGADRHIYSKKKKKKGLLLNGGLGVARNFSLGLSIFCELSFLYIALKKKDYGMLAAAGVEVDVVQLLSDKK